MQEVTIRRARADEYDVIARVWMESWVSIGLEVASEKMLADLRARIPREMDAGWSLYVADDAGRNLAPLRKPEPEGLALV